jgi:hypothetical protein
MTPLAEQPVAATTPMIEAEGTSHDDLRYLTVCQP